MKQAAVYCRPAADLSLHAYSLTALRRNAESQFYFAVFCLPVTRLTDTLHTPVRLKDF